MRATANEAGWSPEAGRRGAEARSVQPDKELREARDWISALLLDTVTETESSMRRTSTKNRFTHETFSRAASNGRPIVYVRFIDMNSSEIIATRYTGIEAETTPKRKS